METYEPISKTLRSISYEKQKISFLCVYFCRLFCFFDIRIFKVNYGVGNKCIGAFCHRRKMFHIIMLFLTDW